MTSPDAARDLMFDADTLQAMARSIMHIHEDVSQLPPAIGQRFASVVDSEVYGITTLEEPVTYRDLNRLSGPSIHDGVLKRSAIAVRLHAQARLSPASSGILIVSPRNSNMSAIGTDFHHRLRRGHVGKIDRVRASPDAPTDRDLLMSILENVDLDSLISPGDHLTNAERTALHDDHASVMDLLSQVSVRDAVDAIPGHPEIGGKLAHATYRHKTTQLDIENFEAHGLGLHLRWHGRDRHNQPFDYAMATHEELGTVDQRYIAVVNQTRDTADQRQVTAPPQAVVNQMQRFLIRVLNDNISPLPYAGPNGTSLR